MAESGRKCKLTDDLQTKLCHILENGTSIKDACALIGIGETTFYEWVNIGNAHASGDDHPRMPRKITERDRFQKFAEMTTRARAKMRDDVIKSLVSFARAGNVQAAMFLMERSDPENWGKRTYAKIEGLNELLELSQKMGIKASDLFQAMVDELHEQHLEEDR